MSNLSYTLIATAAGLIVAIPAMVFYNALFDSTKVIMFLNKVNLGQYFF